MSFMSLSFSLSFFAVVYHLFLAGQGTASLLFIFYRPSSSATADLPFLFPSHKPSPFTLYFLPSTSFSIRIYDYRSPNFFHLKKSSPFILYFLPSTSFSIRIYRYQHSPTVDRRNFLGNAWLALDGLNVYIGLRHVSTGFHRRRGETWH